MKPETPFCGEGALQADCTDLCFAGAPTYTYLHAAQQHRDTEEGAFAFADSTLHVPFSLDGPSTSSQPRRTHTSLFVLPKHILVSRRRRHTLVPGFSFRTPEPLHKAFFVGSQLVCATRHAVYFPPGHVVAADFVDIDHTQQELYILRDRTVEIYSDRKEVFAVDVAGAVLIRCTACPRTVVLATRHDVFLADLARRTTRHLLRVRSRVVDVVYDCSGEGAGSGHRGRAAPDVCTSIHDEAALQSALETEEPAGGPELLFVLTPCRLTLLHMQTQRTRSVRLPHAFQMRVSASYVILARLQTLVFLSKDLRRFCSMQAGFSAFGCNGDVLAFAGDDLTVVNGRKYVFRMDGGWEHASRLFRAGGYYKLQAAYAGADYGDDVPVDTVAGTDGECAHLDRVARCAGWARAARPPQHRSRVRALGRTVCELRADLDALERRHDAVLLAHERRCADVRTAREAAGPVHSRHTLFSLVEEDYRSLCSAEQEAAGAGGGERLAVRRYSASGQHRRGFA